MMLEFDALNKLNLKPYEENAKYLRGLCALPQGHVGFPDFVVFKIKFNCPQKATKPTSS